MRAFSTPPVWPLEPDRRPTAARDYRCEVPRGRGPGVFGPAYFRKIADVLSAEGAPDLAARAAVMRRHSLTPAAPSPALTRATDGEPTSRIPDHTRDPTAVGRIVSAHGPPSPGGPCRD